jgi:hypothetical protein
MQINATFDENLITPRRHKQLMNLLLRREMEKHRDQRLPKHFQLGANRKYSYKPITARYSIWKKKKVHHLIPMVLTGRMRDAIAGTSNVTATATRARLYAKNYFPMKDDFRAQVEIVLPAETAEMAANIGRNYQMLANTSVWARKRSRSKP